MSEEQDLKLACLHQAGGNLDHAKSLFDWVSGSVRATPQSEAPAVSAPNQDKPEQPFNYQHPSKYGTDVPRRCYLEELTPEERAIRDLVGAIEHLGAHPLLTTTVIQLMKAGESLADWVDIGLRDKAIAAPTSEPETHTGNGGEEFLLDEGQRATAPVQSASDQDKALREFMQRPRAVEVREGDLIEVTGEPRHWLYWSGHMLTATQPVIIHPYGKNPGRIVAYAPVQLAPPSPEVASEQGAAAFDPNATMCPSDYTTGPAIPEGFIPWSGGEWDGDPEALVIVYYRVGAQTALPHSAKTFGREWSFDGDNGIIAYRPVETPAEAERTEVDSQAQAATEQEPESKALDQAQMAMTETDHEAGDASVFAHGILLEAEATRPKMENTQPFNPFRLFRQKADA